MKDHYCRSISLDRASSSDASGWAAAAAGGDGVARCVVLHMCCERPRHCHVTFTCTSFRVFADGRLAPSGVKVLTLRKCDIPPMGAGAQGFRAYDKSKAFDLRDPKNVQTALENMHLLLSLGKANSDSELRGFLEELQMHERDFVPRRDHVDLLKTALFLTFILSHSSSAGTVDSRIISGVRGSGQSFVLKASVLCATLCSADWSVSGQQWPPGTVLGGYVPTPRVNNALYYPTDMVASLLRKHSIEPEWSPPNATDEMLNWLRRKNVRIFIAVDEFEHVYKGSTAEANRFYDQCRAICNRSSNLLLWLSGSGGRVRLMAKCLAETSPEFPGYTRVDKYNGKWQSVIIRSRLSVPQCMRLFMYCRPLHERAKEARQLAAACYRYLTATRLLPSNVFHPLQLAEEYEAIAAPLSDLELLQKMVEVYWNSCGLGRAMEDMSGSFVEHLSITKLRSVVSSETDRKAQFLRALADLTFEREPDVADPAAVFTVQHQLEFHFHEVTRQMRQSFGEDSTVTPQDCLFWADDEYLTVLSDGDAPRVAFSHPRYAAVAICQRNIESGGLTFPQRFSLTFPVGVLGQGYPEEMALKSMAASGL